MDKKNISLDFQLEFDNIEDINSSFAKGRCVIAYCGKNRNKSEISRSVFERAINSLYNVPVVGRYIPEEDDFGSHDVDFVENRDGSIEMINATVPYGVVPEGASVVFTDITDENGLTRTYLTTDIILWKRQHGYECIAKNKSFSQSMEIAVNKYHVDPNSKYFVVDDMTFTALCILGTNVTPCFEAASVQVYSKEAVSSYKMQFSQMLDELKQLQEQPSTLGFSDTEVQEREVKMTKERIDEILAEYSFEIDFEIDETLTEEAFRAKLDQIKAEKEATFALQGEVVNELCEKLGAVKMECEWGTCNRYSFVDYDNEKSEVYFYDMKDYKLYGCPYSMAGDTATVDFDGCTRKKYVIADFADGESDEQFNFAECVNEIVTAKNAAISQLQTEFNAYKKGYSTPNTEVEALKAFQNERLNADHNATIDEKLAEFADLESVEEFVALKKKAYEFESIEALEDKCFAIRGRQVKVQPVAKPKNFALKVPIETKPVVENESPYGDLFDLYGNE